MKEILTKEYVLLTDYKDEQREIALFKNDIIEVLDISKPEKWLVRTKYSNIIQVIFKNTKSMRFFTYLYFILCTFYIKFLLFRTFHNKKFYSTYLIRER